MTSSCLVQVGGFLSAGLAIFHSLFDRVFEWKNDIQKLNPINGKVLYTIHIFMIPFFVLYSIISLCFSDTLVNGTPLSKALLIFYVLFWLARGLWQWYFFDPSKLNAPRRQLALHYGLMLVSGLFVLCYGLPLFL